MFFAQLPIRSIVLQNSQKNLLPFEDISSIEECQIKCFKCIKIINRDQKEHTLRADVRFRVFLLSNFMSHSQSSY